MERLTIDLPAGFKASDKWQDGQATEGKFMLQLIAFKSETVSGKRKEKDGTETPWTFTQICKIDDGRKAYSGGKIYGTDDKGNRIAIKTLGKLMPKVADNKTSSSVTVSHAL